MSNLDLTKPQNNAPATQEKKSFSDVLRAKVGTLLKGKRADDFVLSVVSLVQNNPKIAECEQMSIATATLQAQTLELNLNPLFGQAYFVPYKKSGKNGAPDTMLLTMQIGYRGYLQLAIRSGFYKKINVLSIKEGELVSYNPLDDEIEVNLIQDEFERENTPTIGYYAMFEYMNGFKKSLYWSKEKMLAHADKYSQAFSAKATQGKYPKVSYLDFEAGKYNKKDEWLYSSFWYKDFDAMALKTMIRQLISKWGVLSVEMQKAYTDDFHAFDENGKTGDYIDADFEETKEAIEEPKEENKKTTEKDISTKEKDKVNIEDNENHEENTQNSILNWD